MAVDAAEPGLEALLQFVDGKVRGDSIMQDLFGTPGSPTGVDVYHDMAEPDDDTQVDYPSPRMPYMVHRLDVADTQEPWGFYQGTWVWDVYDYGPSSRRVLRIRHRLSVLLTRRFYEEPDGIRALRIWKLNDRDLTRTTGDSQVRRRSLVFSVRYFDQALVEDVEDRDDDFIPAPVGPLS